MKKKALILALFAGILVSTSCADDVLNICTVCEDVSSGDSQELCAGVVAVEAFEQSWENQGYSCSRQ